MKKGSGVTEPQRKGNNNNGTNSRRKHPHGKRVPIALTYITGIGRATAEEICSAVKIDAKEELMNFLMLKF